jgi:hypothetical protein
MIPIVRAIATTACLSTVCATTTRAADERALKLSIRLGVSFLKKTQNKDGSWNYAAAKGDTTSLADKNVGATALAALALLTSGTSPDDPVVQNAVHVVRQATLTLTYTYAISVAVMLLDRLADPADVPLIESLMVRLLAGQKAEGTWSYDCPRISTKEAVRLKRIIDGDKRTPANQPTSRKRTYKDLPAQIKQQLAQIDQAIPAQDSGDNSNTQFAMFALWMGRNRGIPVKRAFARCRNHFRRTQLPDGSWDYKSIPDKTRKDVNPSMTCAGLLGMALIYGLANDPTAQFDPTSTKEKDAPVKGRKPPDPNRDPALLGGLVALASVIDRAWPAVPPTGRGAQQIGSETYFLFGLERVAVIYGLETIGSKDWYAIGAPALLAAQRSDGGWSHPFLGDVSSTAFALLFLNRTNLVPDLTVVMGGRVKDPGAKK